MVSDSCLSTLRVVTLLKQHGLGLLLSIRELNKHLKMIKLFREIEPWIPAQTIHAFLIIAKHVREKDQPIRVMDVGSLMGATSASATRNLRFLVDHGLVMLTENENRRIEKYITITKRGENLVKRLEEL